MRYALALLSLTLLLARCGSDSNSKADVTPQDVASGDSSEDLSVPDAGDTAQPDSVPGDLGGDLGDPDLADSHGSDDLDSHVSDDADSGGGDDTTPEVDTITQTDFVAVPGQRCSQGNRIGTVFVMRSAWGPGIDLSAAIFDRPEVLGNQAEMGDNTCTFYKQLPGAFCEPACSGETTCDPTGTCVPYPVPATDVVLTVKAGQQTQVVEPQAGGTWGTLTLEAEALSAEVTWGPYTITLEETPIAPVLENLQAKLEGGYDNPTSLQITWTPVNSGAQVFTHIPINHHAGGPTYTECAVDGSEGVMQIGGNMLQPLAVSTGLEFQGLDHLRFAAATLPQGCVEFRFGAAMYVNLN